MKKLKLIPYKMQSDSARVLAEKLNVLRVKPDSPTYRHKEGTVLINWGNTRPLTFQHNEQDVYNKPSAVANAANKQKAFETLSRRVPTVDFTTDKEVAQAWVDNLNTVFARTILNGHSGQGIVVYAPGSVVGDAPLYTKYKKKRNEYRVHVVNGAVIDVQEKKRALDGEFSGDQALIRSHGNGWKFCRDNLQIASTEDLNSFAVWAVEAMKLDFGAVDIVYNASENRYYVLEVNTAPGLDGTTIEKYAEAFSKLIED